MYFESILSRQEQLNSEMHALEHELTALPPGELIVVQNGKYTKWFQTDGHHPTYIPKKNKELARKLAYKKYLTIKLKNLQQEQSANTAYLERHTHASIDSLHKILNSPKYKELLSTNFIPLSEELTQWMNEPFPGNPKNPEQLLHQTASGILVRSKSESLIAMLLHTNKIPFRYESPLYLDDCTIYPDFTIRHPRTGEYFYWEHFGMMDHIDYRQKSHFKIDRYISNGILPSDKLITTYETRAVPLNTELVINYIKHYFLC